MNTDMPFLRGKPWLGQAFRALTGLRRRALFFLAAASLGCAASAAPIDVTIYADDGYPPYSYAEDGNAKGIYADILKLAFEQMPQYRVTVVPVPWKRGLRLL